MILSGESNNKDWSLLTVCVITKDDTNLPVIKKFACIRVCYEASCVENRRRTCLGVRMRQRSEASVGPLVSGNPVELWWPPFSLFLSYFSVCT
jgi:hypothetical protein